MVEKHSESVGAEGRSLPQAVEETLREQPLNNLRRTKQLDARGANGGPSVEDGGDEPS